MNTRHLKGVWKMRFCKSKVSKVEFKRRIKKHIAKNERLKSKNSILQEKNETLQNQNQNLQSQNLVLQESASLQRNEALSAENNSLNFQRKLIAKLLSDKEPNADLAHFRKLLNEDFMDFANQDDSLANEAEMVLKLQNIEKELVVVSTCPQIYNKEIIAVAGSFSVGKSAFISSLFKDKSISLPKSIEPSTAISTFVISEKQCKFLGVSNEGVEVNLSALDKEIHAKLKHEFIEKFGFKLKKLMPFMVFQITLDDEFGHLCFIDTPGINASKSSQSTSDDDKNAKEFLDDAGALLWLINADAGTISQSDLDFLDDKELALSRKKKKLFIVLNRADLKTESELKEIINKIKQALEDNFIDFEGISAYSAEKKREYLFETMSLKEFLRTFKAEQNLQKELVNQLDEVFDEYKKAILKKSEKRKQIQNKLHSFGIDLIEMNLDNEANFEKLNQIKLYFDDDDKAKSSIQKLEEIRQEMKSAIDALFGRHLPPQKTPQNAPQSIKSVPTQKPAIQAKSEIQTQSPSEDEQEAKMLKQLVEWFFAELNEDKTKPFTAESAFEHIRNKDIPDEIMSKLSEKSKGKIVFAIFRYACKGIHSDEAIRKIFEAWRDSTQRAVECYNELLFLQNDTKNV